MRGLGRSISQLVWRRLQSSGPRGRFLALRSAIWLGRPIDVNILRDLAGELERDGATEWAKWCWRLLQRLVPFDPEILMGRLTTLVTNGEVNRVRFLVGEAHRRAGFPPARMVWLAGKLVCHGHWLEAGRLLQELEGRTDGGQRLIQQSPSIISARVPRHLGRLASELQGLDAGQEGASGGLAQLKLARLCFTFGNLEIAAELYRQTDAHRPLAWLDRVAMHYARARAGAGAGDPRGNGELAKLLDAAAEDPDALAMLSYAALAVGDGALATRALERAIRVKHGDGGQVEAVLEDGRSILRVIASLREREGAPLPHELLEPDDGSVESGVPKVFICGFGWSGSGAVYDDIRAVAGFCEFEGPGHDPILNEDSETEVTFTNLGTSVYNPLPGVTLFDPGDGFFAGQNYLAPQGTYQSDKQLRYDGTWTRGAHNIKYGYSINRILGGGFAEFFGVGLFTQFGQGSLLANCNGDGVSAPCPGNPIDGYSASSIILGNGNSIFTEKPGFGLPGGGTHDWREGAYVADNWKVTPNFTLTAGLRWSVDTDRANQDLPTPSCASVDPAINPCPNGGNLFDQYQQGLGGKTNQPYANFGPQLGFAYAPPGARNTVLNAAIGVFYESDIFNNTGNARSAVIDSSGPFFNDTGVCGGTNTVPLPGGGSITNVNGVPLSTICSEPIAQSYTALETVKSEYQAATAANNTAANPAYIGGGGGLNSAGVYAAPYKTPYSIQYNFGVQQQFGRGTILSADYVHNGTLKVPLVVDVNHLGAARYMNVAAAQNAIAATEAAYSCADVDCVIAAGGTIQNFAGNGLDSSAAFLGGYPDVVFGLTPSTGAAFPGRNPAVGSGKFILPDGQSGYDALQIVFKQVRSHPVRGVESANFQASYSLSRIVSDIAATTSGEGDQFFNNPPYDYDNPKEFLGRNLLDHKNELSFGGSFNVKHGPQVGVIGHFYSAPPQNLTLDDTAGATAQIFQTDVTGDGTVGDLVPGTTPGAYMHAVNPNNLSKLISSYNSTYAGTPTPAGTALINAGLFTQAQLVSLGGVQQPIAQVPGSKAPGDSAFSDLDANVSYVIRIREGMSLQPGVAMYNVANFSNFGTLSSTLLSQTTTGGPTGAGFGGFLNGPDDEATANGIRTQRGSGTFDQGAPRSTEFSLKFNF